IKNKFYINADYYTNNRTKFNNIFNKLGGSIAKNILLFLNYTYPNCFSIND
ncbi:hypothetical protein GE21DRAFT_1220474, partial [Neurospora crassa]